LLEKQGVQIALEALCLLRNSFPDVRFLIVGGGPYEAKLKSLVKKYNLSQIVTFTGWIKDRKLVDLIMADSAIALATYIPELASYSAYADPTKLKDYLSAALPIVMTSVPHNARELEDAGCALIVEPNSQSVAKALETLFKDDKKFIQMKEASLNYIQQYDWQQIFDSALGRKFYLRERSI
jgi:glycosyltransferase involved in cell wall biosynthesis